MIEYQAGMAFATTIDPLTGQDESLVGSLLVRLFTTLFLVTGGLLSLCCRCCSTATPPGRCRV